MTASTATARPDRRRPRRRIDLVVFILAAAIVTVAVNFFAHRDAMRMRIDATKTRAYSLSPQTIELLRGLEGDWTVALVMVEKSTDRDTRQQVDEVLARYRQAAPGLRILRIDPTDHTTLLEYDRLLGRLRALYRDEIAAYDAALDDGVDAFDRLRIFAQQQTATLGQVLPRLQARNDTLRQRLALLQLLATEGDQVRAAVVDARQTSDARPLPDYDTARSILAQALSEWANELDELGRLLGERAADPTVPADTRPVLTASAEQSELMAREIATAAEPLLRLPEIELARIGRELGAGDTALIISPDRAAVIPSSQLFPKINVSSSDAGVVTFDRRFRGEQIISATFRSLLVGEMPVVVFVHAEEGSLLRSREQNADLLGVGSSLQASQFEVREWVPGRGERPDPGAARRAVWVVIPPLQRQGMEPSRSELALLRATEQLVADGAAVMINLSPSPLPKYGDDDPWASLVASLGVRADSARTIVELARSTDGTMQTQTGQVLRDFPAPHPVCGAINGQQTVFGWTVPLSVADAATATVLVDVRPAPDRWLEDDWLGDLSRLTGPAEGEALRDPVALVCAVERSNPTEPGRRQRCLVVGSGTWMLSYLADAVIPIGGGRMALTNPGNQEMMLASAAWLAGMDDLIAPSPLSQQVARLDGVTPLAQLTWLGVTAIGLPLVSLATGFVVWVVRGRSA